MTKPTVFISYRRATGRDLARQFHDLLRTWKLDVFFDVESLGSGKFSHVIEREIINRDVFFLILTPSTLDSEWVQKEILIAIRHDKLIIPLVEAGFDFYNEIPATVSALDAYNAIEYDYRHPEIAEKALKKALGLSTIHWQLWVGGMALLLMLIGVLWLIPRPNTGTTSDTLIINSPEPDTGLLTSSDINCTGTIIFSDGALLNQVHLLPSQSSSSRSPVQGGSTVEILNSQIGDGGLWYQIAYGNSSGWIPEAYIEVSNNC